MVVYHVLFMTTTFFTLPGKKSNLTEDTAAGCHSWWQLQAIAEQRRVKCLKIQEGCRGGRGLTGDAAGGRQWRIPTTSLHCCVTKIERQVCTFKIKCPIISNQEYRCVTQTLPPMTDLFLPIFKCLSHFFWRNRKSFLNGTNAILKYENLASRCNFFRFLFALQLLLINFLKNIIRKLLVLQPRLNLYQVSVKKLKKIFAYHCTSEF